MIGAGAVVAQRLAGVGAQEDRAGMAQQRLPAMRIGAGDLEVLRRDAVADLAGLLHRARVDQRAPPFQRRADHVAARHAGQQALDGLAHLGDVAGVRAQEDALRELVVFGLAEQVHRHPVRRRRAVGEHEDLARPRDHVDADLAEDVFLRAGDVGVARSGDLVDARHGRRAVGQRRHRLRAADGEGAVHAGHVGRGQHQRVLLAARRGHDHHDLRHAGDLRGDRVHQHARRIRGLAARHVDADTIQRRDLLAQQRAVLVAVAPALAAGLLLALVVAAHPLGGLGQGFRLLRGQAVEGGPQLLARQLQRAERRGVQVVEAGGVRQHGGIAAGAHVGQDLGDARLDRGIGLGGPVQHALELRVEVGVGGDEGAKLKGWAHGGAPGRRRGRSVGRSIRRSIRRSGRPTRSRRSAA